MNPEYFSGAEFAEEHELKQLFTDMNSWLVLNGQKTETEADTFIDPDTHLTVYRGRNMYHVYDVESYQYEMPISQLQEIAPGVQEALHIRDNLMFWYIPAHFNFEFSNNEQRFTEAECGVFYNMDETSAYEEQSMSITLSGDVEAPEAVGEKHNYSPRDERLKLRDFGPDEAEGRIEDLFENLRLEHELGADKMTKSDCAALSKIFAGLLA